MQKATLFFFSKQLDFNDTNYTWHAFVYILCIPNSAPPCFSEPFDCMSFYGFLRVLLKSSESLDIAYYTVLSHWCHCVES